MAPNIKKNMCVAYFYQLINDMVAQVLKSMVYLFVLVKFESVVTT